MGVRYIGQDEDEAAGRTISAKADVLIDYYGAVDLGEIWTGDGDWKTLGVPQIVTDIANGWLDGKMLEGFSSVESYWLRKEFTDMTPEEKEWSDPKYYAKKNMGKTVDPAVMIVHGDCDITVPYLQSTRLADLLQGLPGERGRSFSSCPAKGMQRICCTVRRFWGRWISSSAGIWKQETDQVLNFIDIGREFRLIHIPRVS